MMQGRSRFNQPPPFLMPRPSFLTGKWFRCPGTSGLLGGVSSLMINEDT